MPRRKIPLSKDEVYHIYNRSIAEFIIFRNDADYERMINEMHFYLIKNQPHSFYLTKNDNARYRENMISESGDSKKIIDILAYCLMPTHVHIIIKELEKDGIVQFMKLILNSYSRYFNLKYKRKGPLWEGRFQNVLVKTDEQLIHTTRYIHLNPTTSFLVNDPIEWKYSSYREYLGITKKDESFCHFSDYLTIDKKIYAQFVNDQIGYQRELALIKNLILD